MMQPMTGEEVLALFQKKMGSALNNARVDTYFNGVKNKKLQTIWMKVPREALLDAVRIVDELQSPPHIAVASGADLGDDIEVLYHFQVFWGSGRETTLSVTIGTTCPKSDPHLPSISGIVPGAVITEREKQEFLGIVIDGIPDSRRLFLTENLPEGLYPWRRDEKGVEHMVRNVYKKEGA